LKTTNSDQENIIKSLNKEISDLKAQN